MDRINEGTFDQMMEDAIRCEPLAELPLDFSKLFLEQIKVEAQPKFEVLSWVDLISSIIIAITIGIAFLIPALLPEQLSPLMQWVLQWGEYWLTKAVFSLPGIILSFGAVLLVIGALIAGGKGMKMFLRYAKERRNVLSLL
jgi:hypothetical protein